MLYKNLNIHEAFNLIIVISSVEIKRTKKEEQYTKGT